MAKEEKEYEGLLPPKDDPRVGKALFSLLETVISDKEELNLHNKWLRFYELGRNKHWRKANPSLSLTSANFIGHHRRRTVNLLTDNNPTFNVKKVTEIEGGEEIFNKILRTTEYWWNETEQQDILDDSIYNGETYGVCIEKVIFNLEAEYGIGEVETVVVDPHHFGVYPVRTKNIQKAEAVFHYYPISVREAKRRYPDKASLIKPDEKLLNNMGDERRTVSGMKDKSLSGTESTVTTFLGAIRTLLGGGQEKKSEDKEVIIVECWLKDYEVDEDDKYIYPGNIRCVTAINGDLVVSDMANPSINPNLPDEVASLTYLYDKYPFGVANSNKDGMTIWGEGDFEQLSGLQMEINKSISQYSTMKDRTASIKVVNPKNSGVANTQFAAGIGVINPSTPNHGIHYLEPPRVPKELQESIALYKDLFYEISGNFDMEQANQPGRQVIAYKAIAALLERASTLLRGKIRNYSKLIRERGRMYVSCMQNWYTEDRYISYDDDSGDEVTTRINGNKMIVPLKLTIVSGSTMPKSQVQIREEAIELYDKGAIDNQELLKQMDWPKWKEVANRSRSGESAKLLAKFEMAKVPPEILEYFNNLTALDDNKLARAIDRSEIPTFDQAFNIAGIQQDPLKEIELEKKRGEASEIAAKAKKAQNEADKVLNDIQVDNEKLDIERQKVAVMRSETIANLRINRDKAKKEAKPGGKDAAV